jgi:hypothetical protein
LTGIGSDDDTGQFDRCSPLSGSPSGSLNSGGVPSASGTPSSGIDTLTNANAYTLVRPVRRVSTTRFRSSSRSVRRTVRSEVFVHSASVSNEGKASGRCSTSRSAIIPALLLIRLVFSAYQTASRTVRNCRPLRAGGIV